MASPRDLFLLERKMRDELHGGEYVTATLLAAIPRIVVSRRRDGTRVRATVRHDGTYHGHFSTVSANGKNRTTGYYRNNLPYGVWIGTRYISHGSPAVIIRYYPRAGYLMQSDMQADYHLNEEGDLALLHARGIRQNILFL